MSLRLLIDEDSQAKHLVNLLQNAGHDVITVKEAGLMSKPNEVVFDYAKQEEHLLMTRNCDDFQTLYRANPNHPSILAVYQHSDPSKSMSYLNI